MKEDNRITTWWKKDRKSIEKNLQKYLELYLSNIHSKKVSTFANFWFSKEDSKSMEYFCTQRGYLRNESITNRGILFLDMLEKRKLNKKQLYFNIILTIATCLMTIFTLINLLR